MARKENDSFYVFEQYWADVSGTLKAFLSIKCTESSNETFANSDFNDKFLPISNSVLLSGAGLIFSNKKDK